jgi:hypothetical protein
LEAGLRWKTNPSSHRENLANLCGYGYLHLSISMFGAGGPFRSKNVHHVLLPNRLTHDGDKFTFCDGDADRVACYNFIVSVPWFSSN